jgi:hypothetical protein
VHGPPHRVADPDDLSMRFVLQHLVVRHAVRRYPRLPLAQSDLATRSGRCRKRSW